MAPSVLDDLFVALSDVTRRRVLFSLLDDRRVPLTVPDDVYRGEGSRERLEIELYHSHLPQLTELGLIDWDRTREVTRGPAFEGVRPTLELLRDHRGELPGEPEDVVGSNVSTSPSDG